MPVLAKGQIQSLLLSHSILNSLTFFPTYLLLFILFSISTFYFILFTLSEQLNKAVRISGSFVPEHTEHCTVGEENHNTNNDHRKEVH